LNKPVDQGQVGHRSIYIEFFNGHNRRSPEVRMLKSGKDLSVVNQSIFLDTLLKATRKAVR